MALDHPVSPPKTWWVKMVAGFNSSTPLWLNPATHPQLLFVQQALRFPLININIINSNI